MAKAVKDKEKVEEKDTKKVSEEKAKTVKPKKQISIAKPKRYEPRVIREEPKKAVKAKPVKQVSSLASSKFNDLDELKAFLLDMSKKKEDIDQKDVISALDRFDMSDDDIEAFYDWANSENIDLVDETED